VVLGTSAVAHGMHRGRGERVRSAHHTQLDVDANLGGGAI
jgi:hypothetical protein